LQNLIPKKIDTSQFKVAEESDPPRSRTDGDKKGALGFKNIPGELPKERYKRLREHLQAIGKWEERPPRNALPGETPKQTYDRLKKLKIADGSWREDVLPKVPQ